MKRDIRFDTSDYAVDNAYGFPLVNKEVPGLMKDGAIMTEFVGLRAKMYALRVDARKIRRKSKASRVTSRCLFDEMTRKQSCIRSKLHKVYTISETKIALSPYDDKRYILPDSTNTLSWGHYTIVNKFCIIYFIIVYNIFTYFIFVYNIIFIYFIIMYNIIYLYIFYICVHIYIFFFIHVYNTLF